MTEEQKARIVFLAESIELRARWVALDAGNGWANTAVCRVSSERDSAEAFRLAAGGA